MSLPPGWWPCAGCGLPVHPANRGYRLHPCCDPGGTEQWCPHCRAGPAGCDPARHPATPAGVVMCGRGGRRLAREDLAGGDRAAVDDFTQYLARLRGQRKGDADVRMRP